VTQFVLFAGLLVAGALLLLLPPLLRSRSAVRAGGGQTAMVLAVLREQLAELDADLAAGRIDPATHARSREELERRALDETDAAEVARTVETRPARRWALVLALAVPLLAGGIYVRLGNLDGLDPLKVAGQHDMNREKFAAMVATLAARMEQEPQNTEGWMMLARSWAMLEDFPRAAAAYQRLAELVPDDADVLADWADTVGAVRGTLDGEAEALIGRALTIEPGHPKALALAGTVAFRRADYAGAAAQWEKILNNLPPGAEVAEGVRNNINEARTRAGLPLLAAAPAASALAAPASSPVPAPAPAAVPAAATQGAGALQIAGRLEIDAALRDRVNANDVVFLFVRGVAGGPPLAALRFTVGELPRDFSFAGVALMGGAVAVPDSLALAARVSKSGNVTAAAGDLEGRIEGLTPQASGVRLVIDKVRQ
jgi:cytochrome c-type biogenesis protein CcmH